MRVTLRPGMVTDNLCHGADCSGRTFWASCLYTSHVSRRASARGTRSIAWLNDAGTTATASALAMTRERLAAEVTGSCGMTLEGLLAGRGSRLVKRASSAEHVGTIRPHGLEYTRARLNPIPFGESQSLRPVLARRQPHLDSVGSWSRSRASHALCVRRRNSSSSSPPFRRESRPNA